MRRARRAEASYDLAVDRIRVVWHELKPEYKQELIDYLAQSPVGADFDGLLFLTKRQADRLGDANP